MVALKQTAMDGAPRDRIDRYLAHEGHITEHIVVVLEIRNPRTHQRFETLGLILRDYQYDGEITAVLGRVDGKHGSEHI